MLRTMCPAPRRPHRKCDLGLHADMSTLLRFRKSAHVDMTASPAPQSRSELLPWVLVATFNVIHTATEKPWLLWMLSLPRLQSGQTLTSAMPQLARQWSRQTRSCEFWTFFHVVRSFIPPRAQLLCPRVWRRPTQCTDSRVQWKGHGSGM